MKRLLNSILALTAILTTICTAETPSGFSAKIFPTKAVNTGDQFAGILPNRPPFIPTVEKVTCGEPFEIAIFFIGAKIQNGTVELSGKLIVTNAEGKKKEIPLDSKITKLSGDTAGVFLFPKMLKILFEHSDPKGKYTFDLELTDRISGKTAKGSASVEYVEKVDPEPGAKAFEKIANYYRNPCPEYIIPAFQEFLTNLPKQKAKEKNNFNPLPQLAIFYFLLKENPQCVPAFAEFFKSLHNEEKYLAAVVLNFVSESSAKVLNANQRNAIKKQLPADPFQFEKAVLPWQLDICWAEFFVRGTKAPVMKIVNAMSLAKDSVSIADYKKIAAPSKEDQRKLMNGLTVMAAQWSMKSLIKQHPLIRWYVEAALVRGEVKEPFAAALSAKTIGMNIKQKKE